MSTLRAISSFLGVFKRCLLQTPENQGLFGKGFINSLPNDKILDWSILKAFASDKLNDRKIEISFGKGRKQL